MQLPVYLACRTLRDKSGTLITIRERRLIRQNPDDRIIALVEAPPGSRVRRKRDQYGFEHLLVPVGTGLWARLFGEMITIPAKYVIAKARLGESGLSLIPLSTSESETPSASDDVCATA